MPYIGKSPVGGGFHKLDNLTASATATYALTLGSAAYYPETANQLLVSLNGVIQAPQDSFTVSGSNLIFDSALTASDSIDFVVALGDVLGVQGVTDGAVTTNKIANGAVTAAKLAAGVGGVAGISSSSTSGTALSIDANNIVTTPSKPMFKASKNANAWQSFGSTNWTTFPFNLADFNVGSSYDTTNYKFVAPINGVYAFYLMNYFDSGSGVLLRLYDGSQEIALSQHNGTHALTLSLSCLVQLNANDEIYAQGKVLTTNSDDWYGATSYAQFTGCLVS